MTGRGVVQWDIGEIGISNKLSLLGGFAFSVEGGALLGISAGSQRLLAFLVVRERVVTRSQVAGTFWREVSDDHAGASLRSAVSRLDVRVRQAVKVTAQTWPWPRGWLSMSTGPRRWPEG